MEDCYYSKTWLIRNDGFRKFFHKRSNKNGGKNRNSIEDPTRVIIDAEGLSNLNVMAKEYRSRKHKPLRRTSDSLSNDPAYLNRLFGISGNDVVLVKKPQASEYYDKPKFKGTNRRYSNTNNRRDSNTLLVYTASVSRNSTNFNPSSSSRPSEPFPYKVYDQTPRRSTLYYGISEDGKPIHSDEHLSHSTRRSPDDYAVPSTSQSGYLIEPHEQIPEDDKERLRQHGRRVTILTPNETGDIDSTNYKDETDEAKSVRKTVLRFRPHSSASRSPRESTKIMVFRADQIEHPPPVLSKHVHQQPLKKIRPTPMLMTDDGRILKPLDSDRQKRNSVDEDVNRVRVSMADIENVCKVPRRSREVNPVYHPRNSVNRSSMMRQSVISRQLANENDTMRESIQEKRKSFSPYLEENMPVVYAVPIIPSRNRSQSLVRQSATAYNFKQSQRHDGGDDSIHYHADENKYINDKARYSNVSHAPDYIKMKSDKPIVVYEVQNLKENRTSISKSSKNKNADNIQGKPHASSYEKHFKTDKKVNPEVEVIYQESKPPLRTIEKIKSKFSLKNKIKVEKSYDNNCDDSLCPLYHQTQQSAVYTAEVPSQLLPEIEPHKAKKILFKKQSRTTCGKKGKVQSKDYCALACETNENTDSLKKNKNSNIEMVSSYQQTDFENDLDFLCYPAEKLSKS